MSRLRVGVIGVGYLGKEHARILASFPDVELVGVADVNPAQAETVARRCGTRPYTDYRDLLDQVDAVTVAVPTSLHAAVGAEVLRRGIACMMEKPLAATLAQAEELVSLASRHGCLLQVGHIERFNPAFVELERRPLRPKFIEAHRMGVFTGRALDTGVVLDLMIHDLDLVTTLVKSEVTQVEALGVSLFGGHEDLAHARLRFANGCVAVISASRVSLKASRRMRLFGPEGYASLDYQHRRLVLVQPTPLGRALRAQGTAIRQIPQVLAECKDRLYSDYLHVCDLDLADEKAPDQLTTELHSFVHCVRTGTRPKVSGEDGRDAVALASRIVQEIQHHSWEGTADGPAGPYCLPEPVGELLAPHGIPRAKAA
jgi:predicted dehydrogenase